MRIELQTMAANKGPGVRAAFITTQNTRRLSSWPLKRT